MYELCFVQNGGFSAIWETLPPGVCSGPNTLLPGVCSCQDTPPRGVCSGPNPLLPGVCSCQDTLHRGMCSWLNTFLPGVCSGPNTLPPGVCFWPNTLLPSVCFGPNTLLPGVCSGPHTLLPGLRSRPNTLLPGVCSGPNTSLLGALSGARTLLPGPRPGLAKSPPRGDASLRDYPVGDNNFSDEAGRSSISVRRRRAKYYKARPASPDKLTHKVGGLANARRVRSRRICSRSRTREQNTTRFVEKTGFAKCVTFPNFWSKLAL